MDGARAGLGVLALAAPDRLAAAVGTTDGASLRGVTRVLGLRYVVQAGVGSLAPSSRLWRADAAVDVLHALSMLLAAHRYPQHRRLALASAVAATTFAGLDLHDAERTDS